LILAAMAANNRPGETSCMSVLPACANCNTALQGPYCSNCGQKASDFHRPIWWILGEFMDAVFSFDSRTFRTLWLLFGEPGEFTRRYNSGQRASLLPPFRLFVIATFVFFITLQLTGLALVAFQSKIIALKDLSPEAVKALEKGDGSNFATSSDGKTYTAIQLRFFVPVTPGAHPALTSEEKQQIAKGKAELDKEDSQNQKTDDAGWLKTMKSYGRRVLEGFEKSVENPLRLNASLNVWLPRIMLFLVPVFALLLALMHWWPRVYYVEHLIFALHIHTVMFFALTIVALAVAMFGGMGFLELAIWPILAVYFWMALKRVYGRGVFLTSVKFVAILLIYSVILTASLSMALLQALAEV
jgi:hypothetical protein